ncbi:MAG: alpha/beta hydrolase [Chloroflexi bacterium]|nr:alpha/beta hydrolase [Chloroflexota bacterium]
MHHIDRGEGSAMMLIHGSGRSIADWDMGIVERLARRHRVLAFDLYGCGFSERRPSFTYGYDLWTQQAVDLLDALHVDQVAVVGHSLGGMLACVLAADHPGRVSSVVTIGTGLAIEPAQFLPAIPGVGELLMARSAMYGPAVSRHQEASLEAAYRIRGTRRALLMYIRRQMTIDGLRLLRGVFEEMQVPVLHLSGTQDRNIPPDASHRLAKRTRGQFRPIAGAGHFAHTDAPDCVVAQIEDFLSPPLPAQGPA